MKFLLNTGRTIRQGSFVERKNSPAYRDEASSCRMNPVDMMESRYRRRCHDQGDRTGRLCRDEGGAGVRAP